MKTISSVHLGNALVRKAVITTLVLLLSLASMMVASADSGSRTLDYLLGTGPLCDIPEPSPCPDVARAPNGDTVEISGAGTISIHPKSATGGGSFTHKRADGSVVGSGTWQALDLLSFHSYGSGAAQGLPANFEGGRAELLVRLTGPGGVTFEGILRITCLLGDKIPVGAEEGVRLNLKGPINFNEEVSGLTLFID